MSNANRSADQHRRGFVSELNREESKKLRDIWDATENKPPQGVFGAIYGVGGQAAVGHFLNGRAAISLKAARGFAEGLKCDILAFSDRLAREAADLGRVSGEAQTKFDMTPLSRSELQMVLLFRGLAAEQQGEILRRTAWMHSSDGCGEDSAQCADRPRAGC